MVGENVRIAMSEPKDLRLDTGVSIPGMNAPLHFVNTGVPHAVALVPGGEPFEELDVFTLGRAIRYHEAFAPAGTNANFATVIAPGHIEIRTYERGVEDETLACGTGMVACSLIHHLLTGAPSPVRVTVAGGDTLEIGFEKSGDSSFTKVTLTGPADFVFEGEIEI
jgi:diaminopimelate epimerase